MKKTLLSAHSSLKKGPLSEEVIKEINNAYHETIQKVQFYHAKLKSLATEKKRELSKDLGKIS